MRAARKNSSSRRDARNRSEEATGFNRISGMTIKHRAKHFAYPEVWGYIRPKPTAWAFECQRCAEKFETADKLRQHQVDCGGENANEPL